MATDEASLLAALRQGEPVTLARGTVVRLTRTLRICENNDAFFSHKYNGRLTSNREHYHCECRHLRPRREGQLLRGGRRREG